MNLTELLQTVPQTEHQLLHKAHHYAQKIYGEHTNHHGEPLFQQGISMADTLSTLQLHAPVIAAAMLHAAPTLPYYQHQQLASNVSTEVALLVKQIQLLLKQKHPDNHQTAAIARKSILLSTKDMRVILIMLAEKIYLLSKAQHHQPTITKQLAQNCRSVYAPIAHALGVDNIKNELEDLSFATLEPQEYQELQQQSQSLLKLSKKRLQKLQKQFQTLLENNQITAEISGRIKNLYSINQKIKSKNTALQHLKDLIAIRIIVKDENSCYQLLKIIHQNFQPSPGRFKDYIALPKMNGYQSLHTTIIHQQQLVEIQIRTQYMHRWAEFGIAAHFTYKEQSPHDNQELNSIKWFRSMAKQMAIQIRQPE